jgi:cytoplasmic polyadenylation element-binding protein
MFENSIGIIFQNFIRFGQMRIDWPKRVPHSVGPPSGYAFLIFESENSIEHLLSKCHDLNERKIFEIRTNKIAAHPVLFLL